MNNYLITETEFVFQIKNQEIAIGLKKLRQSCPCANCKGEKDVFGNVYRGPEKKLNESSFQIHTVRTVGNYAVRIFWKDQHANGIYTFDFLKSLNESD